MNQPKMMSELAMNLSYAAIDRAAKMLEQTQDTFIGFLLILDNQGEIKLAKLAGVADAEQLNVMAGNILNKAVDSLVAYTITYDGISDSDDDHHGSIVVETGCLSTGNGVKMIQEYSLDPTYQDIGNIKIFDEKLPLRIGESSLNIQTRNDTKEMIQPLCRVPFAIFQKIAGADGRIDSQEVDAFVNALGEGLSMNEVSAAIVQQAINDAEVYMSMVQNQALSAEEDIISSKQLLSSEFDTHVEKEYLTFLEELTDKITQPKKKGMFSMGRKLNDAQIEAIQVVKDMLNVV